MDIDVFPAGPLLTNCYLLSKGGHGLIIDPSGKVEELSTTITLRGLVIDAILLTHGHFDHIMAVNDLSDIIPNVPLLIGEEDFPLLSDPIKNLSGPLNISCRNADTLLKGDEVLRYLSYDIKVLSTPGHSPGSVSYYIAKEKKIFSGDVLFKGSVGRTDLMLGDSKTLTKTLKEKILTLPKETQVFPGHGPITNLEEEKHSNPFLQLLTTPNLL